MQMVLNSLLAIFRFQLVQVSQFPAFLPGRNRPLCCNALSLNPGYGVIDVFLDLCVTYFLYQKVSTNSVSLFEDEE